MSGQQPPQATAVALLPEQIARQVEEMGVAKTRTAVVPTLLLAVMAGVFIGLGGSLAGTMAGAPDLGVGPTRLLMGLGLSMALFMVIVTGVELFTGNNLLVIGLFSRRISLWSMARNWLLVYVGNLAGALIVVLMVYYSRWGEQADFSFAGSAVAAADAKLDLPFHVAFVRGILANALVCLAIWLAVAGRTVTDKLLGVVLPVTTFVAAGFEHSIANMYFVPLGVLLSTEPEALLAAGLAADEATRLTVPWVVHNLVSVTLGNIVGSSGLVGLVYWFIHLRRQPTAGSQPSEHPGQGGWKSEKTARIEQ